MIMMRKIILCLPLLMASWLTVSKDFAYVGSLLGGVYPIDLETNTVGAKIDTGPSATFYVVVTFDNKTIYAAGFTGNIVIPIDVATSVVGTPINPLPQMGPFGLAISLDGKILYVATNMTDAVVPIEIATNTPGAPITVGDQPDIIAIAPDGTKAYVTNNNDGSVSVIDLTNNSVITTITGLVGRPAGITVTPDGATVYVSNDGAGMVTPIPTATNIPGTPILVGAGSDNLGAIAITPDGKTAYVANSSANVVVPIDVATNTPGTPIAVGTFPLILVITADGKRLYVTNRDSNSVTRVDLTTNLADFEFTGIPSPTGIALTPSSSAHFVGTIQRNQFLNKSEWVVVMTWQASLLSNVSLYRIYKNNVLIGTVSAGDPLQFCAGICLPRDREAFSLTVVTTTGSETAHIPLVIS